MSFIKVINPDDLACHSFLVRNIISRWKKAMDIIASIMFNLNTVLLKDYTYSDIILSISNIVLN